MSKTEPSTAIVGLGTAVPAPLRRFLPILDWLPRYRRADLPGDLMAGLIVAIMLVPQGMSYALLAGLPPQVGLYASILPLILYGVFGTSRSLAVGPVAIVSLMVASGLGGVAGGAQGEMLGLAVTLALLVGIFQAAMGFLRVGFLVNFLSHPVLIGFTAAAAIIIGFSQVKHLLGFDVPRGEYFYEQVGYTLSHLGETNLVTLVIGSGGVAVLLYFKVGISAQLRRWGVHEHWIVPVSKSAPLIIVLLGTLLVWGFDLTTNGGVQIVGEVPPGLPPLTLPRMDADIWRSLLPTALTISFVGYMESISVAKSLASKRRQKVGANQELIALGLANLGAAFSGGYPVTGGFSRSVVNFAAGANTGLASIVTALLVAVTVVFLTPLFYFLPKAILGAIVLVAVSGLVDWKSMRHIWQYNRGDAAVLAATFIAVLAVGIESGIVVGVALAMLIFIWRTSNPHVAVVGRLGESEIYRNVRRHKVTVYEKVLLVRVDQSLYFANTKFLEDTVLGQAADNPQLEHFVLIGTAINFIDASALEILESLVVQLHDMGVQLHLAAIKGPVMDRLQEIGFVEVLGSEYFHLSTHDAVKAIGCAAQEK